MFTTISGKNASVNRDMIINGNSRIQIKLYFEAINIQDFNKYVNCGYIANVEMRFHHPTAGQFFRLSSENNGYLVITI